MDQTSSRSAPHTIAVASLRRTVSVGALSPTDPYTTDPGNPGYTPDVYGITFSASPDPNGEPITGYTIDWGGGVTSTAPGTATSAEHPQHGYLQGIKDYIITVTANDADSGSDPEGPYVGKTGVRVNYYETFEDQQAAEIGGAAMRPDETANDPSDDRYFLAPAKSASLVLEQVPGHTTVRGSFFLYVLNGWDQGSNPPDNDGSPDGFTLTVGGQIVPITVQGITYDVFRPDTNGGARYDGTDIPNEFPDPEEDPGDPNPPEDPDAGPSPEPDPDPHPDPDPGPDPNPGSHPPDGDGDPGGGTGPGGGDDDPGGTNGGTTVPNTNGGDAVYEVSFEFLHSDDALVLELTADVEGVEAFSVDDVRVAAEHGLNVILDGMPEESPGPGPHELDPGAFIPASDNPDSPKFVPLGLSYPSWLADDSTITLRMTGGGADNVSVWKTQSTASVGDRILGGGDTTETWTLGPGSPTPQGSLYVMAKDPTSARGVTFELSASGIARNADGEPIGGTFVATDTASGTVTRVQIRVDANRDGQISFDDGNEATSDLTKPDKPYRFWINDDRDVLYRESFVAPEEEDDQRVTAQQPVDSADNRIAYKRDLEDFARIQVRLPNDLDYRSVRIELLGQGADAPGLRLFRAVSPDSRYLTDTATADLQLRERAVPQFWGGSVEMSRFEFETFVGPGGDGFNLASFIFEGTAAGRATLRVTFSDGGRSVGQSETDLHLQPVLQMFEHYTVGDTATRDTVPNQAAQRAADSGTYGQPQTDAERDYILFVHGWRSQPWTRRAFAATAYKRLWWEGYKGRFGLFSWPTEYEVPPTVNFYNYRRSELAAWRSAEGLRRLLRDLNAASNYPGRVNVMAHSMGNIVISEALRLELEQPDRREIVRHFVASQAAMSAEAYDGAIVPVDGPLDQFGKGGPRRVAADLRTPNYYVEHPTTHRPYFADLDLVISGKFVNYYNPDDFALGIWIRGQWSKDLPVADDEYHYNPQAPGFFRAAAENAQTELIWARGNDRYEIMAHVMQARTNALGNTPILPGGPFNEELNLKTTPGIAFTRRSEDHSGQFRSFHMRRRTYWDRLLNTFEVVE